MITIDKRIFKDIDKLTKKLDKFQRKQIPFATMTALNETAKDVKKAEDKKIKRVFKKPTKTTQNSVIILFAKKTKLESVVKIKDRPFSGSNVSVSDYLFPQIHGGPRMRKGSEKRLQSTGRMKKGRSLFPGQGIKTNKFGNIPKGKMTKIMTGNKYFSVKHGTPAARHLHPGIYERIGRNIRPVIAYGDKPKYQPRFRFFKVGEQVINKKLVPNFVRALDRALATAR